jgi:hypothetical protein
MKLSARALSYGFPIRLMLGSMPCASKSSVYSLQAYCTPQSEWWIRLPRLGLRVLIAISRAATARLARKCFSDAQPITRRLNASSRTARKTGQHRATRQVRHDPPVMARVGRHRHERALAQTQIVLSHQPQDPFVVGHKALATQLRRNPPIAIAAVRQRHALNGVTHSRLFLARRRCTPAPVVAGAAEPRQHTHPLDRELASRAR